MRAGVERLAAVRSPGLHRLLRPDARRDGHATAQPLAETDQIGDDAGRERGEHVSRATEAGPDLVGDEQRARGVAGGAQPGEEAVGREHDPAASEDRLDEHRADVAAPDGCEHLTERHLELGGVARIRREGHVRVELRGERRAERLGKPQRRERAVGQAVVAAGEGDHPGPPRRQQRRLDRRGDRVGARQTEHHSRPRLRIEGRQLLQQLHLRRRRVDVAQRQRRGVHPPADGVVDRLRAVTEEHRTEARGEVDVHVAVDVDDVGPVRLRVDDGREQLSTGERPRVPPRIERR